MGLAQVHPNINQWYYEGMIYCKIFSIVNVRLCVDCDTQKAVSLSASVNMGWMGRAMVEWVMSLAREKKPNEMNNE